MGMFSKKKNAEMSDRILLGNTEFVFDRKLGFHVGEWTVWDRKTKILLEFQSTEGNIGDIVLLIPPRPSGQGFPLSDPADCPYRSARQ